MPDVVIFSSDCAPQLDLLLRSIERFVGGADRPDVRVLYSFGSADSDRAYNAVRAQHRHVHYTCAADHRVPVAELEHELLAAHPGALALSGAVAFTAPCPTDAAPGPGQPAELPALWQLRADAEFLAGRRLSLDALIAAAGSTEAEPVWVVAEPVSAATEPDRAPAGAPAPADGAPRVSVVIPCFNCGPFLADTVGSVLAQTFTDHELIIVDDGSTDDCAGVAERLIEEHPAARIRLLRQRNAGHPSYTRNTGIAHARGELVLCLDGDDMLTPSFLERCVAALDGNPETSIAYTDQHHFGARPGEAIMREYDFRLLTHANLIGIASVFRRRAWEEVGGFNAHMRYEDWDFWIGCGTIGHFGIKVHGTHWLYRTRADGRFISGGAPQDRRTKAIIVGRRPELYTAAQQAWARAVLDEDPSAELVDDREGEIPALAAFPPAGRVSVPPAVMALAATAPVAAAAPAASTPPGAASAPAAPIPGLSPFSPALGAARAVARATGASLLPVDDDVPADPDGAILLVDRRPSDQLLAALAAALPQATALALWAPGWDEPAAVEALGRHGFEHGTVEILGGPEPGALAVLVASEDRVAAAVPAAPAQAAAPREFRALAVMPAYNEADVIFHAIGALVSEGVDVYLIDHNSTDETVAAATPWLGRGLLKIERFPQEAGYPERNEHEMVWRDILRRVQDVSRAVPADWYLFVNADEFREAPWPGVTLAEGLREVDELGYSAVNFELFDFRPVDEEFRPGEDPRRRLRHYDRPGRHDVLQIKAWKRQAQEVDIVSHGGHDALFEGKRIFPVPFILRHYPIRSSAHGARKVMGERLPRFAAEERAGGWHVQYDGYAGGKSYLHDPAALTPWDGTRVRAELLAARMRELLLSLCLSGIDPTRAEVLTAELTGWMERRGEREAPGPQLQAAQERLTAAARGVQLVPAVELDTVAHDLSVALEAHALLSGDLLTAASLVNAREQLLRGAG